MSLNELPKDTKIGRHCAKLGSTGHEGEMLDYYDPTFQIDLTVLYYVFKISNKVNKNSRDQRPCLPFLKIVHSL